MQQTCFLGHLTDKIDELSTDESYVTMCASAMGTTVAAAFLQANGFENVQVFLRSMGAWKAKDYPVKNA